MSTRAMYTFKDAHYTVHVYKHSDGYPEGAISWIANARNYAWPLPKFEADDFAAAFVAANKPKYDPEAVYPSAGGGVRLCGNNIKEPWDMAQDAEYHYVVECNDKGVLNIEVYEIAWYDKDNRQSTKVFTGTLGKAIQKFKAEWVEDLLNK